MWKNEEAQLLFNPGELNVPQGLYLQILPSTIINPLISSPWNFSTKWGVKND